MPHIESLYPGSPWERLSTNEADWANAAPNLLESMLVQLLIIRRFEETVLALASQGLIHGPAHSSIGQEGAAVGSIIDLKATDKINGSHRGHHQFLAKSLSYLTPTGYTLTAPIEIKVQQLLQRTLAEILGLAQGFSHGRGGSMHLKWDEAGAIGTNAIVGGGVPLAAGAALASQYAHTDEVIITYFGDGAINIGSTLETLNIAAAWKLPLCFFIENNLYAVSTKVSEVTAEPRLSARGLGVNIPSIRVNGMDCLAVYLATQKALKQLRAGKGPVIIEAEVYRYFHQNGPFPGSAFGYRSKEEEAHWQQQDPIIHLSTKMLERQLCTQETIDHFSATITALLESISTEFINTEPNGVRQIRPELWPDPAFVDVGIRSDLKELTAVTIHEEERYTGTLIKGPFISAIAAVMNHQMTHDPKIIVMGEDIHRLRGGTNGATKGLSEKFPQRILATPISENAFCGIAGGAALDGRVRPVIELMYPDFLWVAADQLFNQIGKARHMYGGSHNVPLVLRTKVAMGDGYGSQHSMDPAGLFATARGWRIVAPATPFDYIGLMNFALQCEDPVLVLEHVDLYTTEGHYPETDYDYQIPFGRAKICREGMDVTLLTYLAMVHESLRAVEQSGLDAEVIDLRFLDYASIDWETIESSIKKTNTVLIVEQGAQGTAYGTWLADEIQRRYFDWLDQPIKRVMGGVAAPSISKVLERASIAQAPEVVAGLQDIMRDKGQR